MNNSLISEHRILVEHKDQILQTQSLKLKKIHRPTNRSRFQALAPLLLFTAVCMQQEVTDLNTYSVLFNEIQDADRMKTFDGNEQQSNILLDFVDPHEMTAAELKK